MWSPRFNPQSFVKKKEGPIKACSALFSIVFSFSRLDVDKNVTLEFYRNDGRAVAERHNVFLSSHLERNTVMSTLYKQETHMLLNPCAHLFLHLQDATVVLKCVHSARHSSF